MSASSRNRMCRTNIRAKQKDHPAYITSQGRWLPVRYVDEMISQINILFDVFIQLSSVSVNCDYLTTGVPLWQVFPAK